jgi:hypothetical protein
MKTITIRAILQSRALIVVLIALYGCIDPVASGQTSISFNDQRMTTTAPTPPSKPCIVPPAESSFLTTENTIYLYFNATVTDADTLSMDWIAPNGDVLTGPTWQTASGKFCYGAALNISSPKPGHYGAWQAQVRDHYALLFSVPFTVRTSALTITGNMTTAALITNGSGNADFCARPVPRSTFSTTDPSVGVWFTFDNGKIGDVLKINWVHPSGVVDSSQPTATLGSNGSFCYAWFLPISGNEAETEPGFWQVRLLVNGSLVFSLPFTIAAPPAANSTLTITTKETTAALITNGSGNADFCAHPAPKTSFLTTDPSVGVWFTFNNGKSGDVLLINWIQPSGAVYPSQPTATLSSSGSFCYAWFLPISGSEPPTEPGNWQVRLLLNGSLAFSLAFTIEPNPYLANILTPAPGSILNSSSVIFTWAAAPDAGGYALVAGTKGVGSNDLLPTTYPSGYTSSAVDGVPTNGGTLYVRLYTYTAVVSGPYYVDYVYKEATIVSGTGGGGGGTSGGGGGSGGGTGGIVGGGGTGSGNGGTVGGGGNGGGSTSNGLMTPPSWGNCVTGQWDPDNPGWAIFTNNNCPYNNVVVDILRSDGFSEGQPPLQNPGDSSEIEIDLSGSDYNYTWTIFVCPHGSYPVSAPGDEVSNPKDPYYCQSTN